MEKVLVEDSKLRLMVFSSALELGKKVDRHLIRLYNLSDEYTFMIPMKENYFADGHFKVELGKTVRGKDIFALTDIGNYSIEYKMHGFINHTSPNDLFCQLKDGLGACNSHARRLNVVMPLLYAGRQHRRITRENLMCGRSLQELQELLRVRTLLTFDAHDQGVEHSTLNMEFDNIPTYGSMLEQFINDVDISELKDLVFIAPDNGATTRSNEVLNCFSSSYVNRDSGSFIKRRDYNTFVDGKYPVVAHAYSGSDSLEGKTILITDDIISSGGSILDVIKEVKKRGAKHVYIIISFVLFVEGYEKFSEYYEKGLFDRIYTTNLSYIPEDLASQEWIRICDCSNHLAHVIRNIHEDKSISPLIKDKSRTVKILEKKFNVQTKQE